MNFTYSITYQNKQTRTVTVLYIPSDPKALSTILVMPYEEGDSETDLHNRILVSAPLETWQQAIAREDVDFTMGEGFVGSEALVTAAIEARTPAITLESKKATKVTWVDQMRVSVETDGVSYEFPGGLIDTVQLRNDRDRGNVNGLVSSAMILKSQGVTAPVFSFRAASNNTYDLTPDQVIDLGMAASTFAASLYQTGWQLKELINAATTIEEVESIQWPEN